jgi:hypothetical protein
MDRRSIAIKPGSPREDAFAPCYLEAEDHALYASHTGGKTVPPLKRGLDQRRFGLRIVGARDNKPLYLDHPHEVRQTVKHDKA